MKSVVILLLIASLAYASGTLCTKPCPSPLLCPKIGCLNGKPEKPVCRCCPICLGRLGEQCGKCRVRCEDGLVCRYAYGSWFAYCGTCQYSYKKK